MAQTLSRKPDRVYGIAAQGHAGQDRRRHRGEVVAAIVHHHVSGVICPAAFHSLVYDSRDTQNVGTFLFAPDDLAFG